MSTTDNFDAQTRHGYRAGTRHDMAMTDFTNKMEYLTQHATETLLTLKGLGIIGCKLKVAEI